MRTEEEIKRQIHGLKVEKENIPEYSGFGGNNWAEIDAKLDILEGLESLDDMDEGDWDEMDETNEIFRAAEEADDWMNSDEAYDLFEED